ncbi:hypothetical protein JL09_g5796, partial [Pichia kudriavzevii]
LIEMVNHF